jgi:cytochrome P450
VVEDVLRVHAPVQGLFRVTTAATVLGGMSLPSRAVVSLRLGAANRDPARVGELQSRAESTPSAGHLSFGFGLHHCVGAPLARRELEVALDVISGRFARLMLAIPVTQLTYTRSVMTRSLLTLPLIGTFHAD